MLAPVAKSSAPRAGVILGAERTKGSTYLNYSRGIRREGDRTNAKAVAVNEWREGAPISPQL